MSPVVKIFFPPAPPLDMSNAGLWAQCDADDDGIFPIILEWNPYLLQVYQVQILALATMALPLTRIFSYHTF